MGSHHHKIQWSFYLINLFVKYTFYLFIEFFGKHIVKTMLKILWKCAPSSKYWCGIMQSPSDVDHFHLNEPESFRLKQQKLKSNFTSVYNHTVRIFCFGRNGRRSTNLMIQWIQNWLPNYCNFIEKINKKWSGIHRRNSEMLLTKRMFHHNDDSNRMQLQWSWKLAKIHCIKFSVPLTVTGISLFHMYI